MRKTKKNEEKVVKNQENDLSQQSEKTARKSAPSEKYEKGKTRTFSIVTYLSKGQLYEVLFNHSSSIRAYAFILHDKDEKEPHIHLCMRLYSSWSSYQISRWFLGYKDIKGEFANTLIQHAKDTNALKEYYLHTDFESRQQNKHIYDRKEIYDKNMWDLSPRTDAYDETLEIIDSLLAGMREREIIRRYGKNYLYHRSQYRDAMQDIYNQENGWIVRAETKQRLREEEKNDLIEELIANYENQ